MKKSLSLISLSFLTFFCSSVFSQHAVTTVKNLNAPATPYGVCLTSDGNTMYLTSYNGHNIRKIDLLTNVVTVVAGTGQSGMQNGSTTSSKFSFPTGITVNSTNTKLYVADNGNSLIREIDLTTNQVSSFAGDGTFAFADGIGSSAKLNQPFDIKISGDSVLYFSDAENHCVRKINIASRQVTTIFGTGGTLGFQDGIGTNTKMNGPRGLALSPNGNTLYIVEAGFSIVRKADLLTNTLSHIAGDGTQGSSDNAVGIQAKFYTPHGITVDPINPNILYIVDTYNHVIRMMNTTTTEVSTIAGTGDLAFADNPNGLLAKFNYPINAIASADGQNVYITDRENNRIRLMKTDNPNTSGIQELDSGIEVYPTLVHDLIRITSEEHTFDKIEIVDINGRVLETHAFLTTNNQLLSNIKLNEGLCIIKVYASNTLLFTTKILKH